MEDAHIIENELDKIESSCLRRMFLGLALVVGAGAANTLSTPPCPTEECAPAPVTDGQTIALVGGLALMFVSGAGSWAVDARRRREFGPEPKF